LSIGGGGGGGAVGPTYLPYRDAAFCRTAGSTSAATSPATNFGEHYMSTVGNMTVDANIFCTSVVTQGNPPTGGGPSAVVDFPGGATYYEGQFTVGPMSGWSSGHRVDLQFYSGATTTAAANIAWLVAFGCFHFGNQFFGGGTFSSFQTLNVAAPGGAGNNTSMTTLTGLTVPAACVATDDFLLRVARQQGANGDTSASGDTAWLFGAQVLWN
jgi:hypothetical protein